MKITWVLNGKLQLILTPSDEREVGLLKELAQGPVDIQTFEKLQTGTDSHNDAVVIMPKPLQP